MKKLLLSLSLLISFCIKSQTVVSSCNGPDSIVKKYRKDADRLAVKRAYYANTTYKDSVKIDPVLKARYLAALIAVYNATLLPVVDTIVDSLNLHTRPAPDLNMFTVNASPANSWMQNLQNSVIPTGYAPIDQLITKYHLQQAGYYQSTQYDVVVFAADTNYNIVALTHTFAAVPTVLGSDPHVTFNDVKDITDSINPIFTMLTYAYGWGSCGDGCDFKSYWTFKVSTADCKVEYVGHTGYALGTGTGTNTVGIKENKQAFDGVMLYPNPAGGKLYINTAIHLNATAEVEITNTLGQLVLKASLNESATPEIDVHTLKTGIYYLKLQDADGYRTLKFIKE